MAIHLRRFTSPSGYLTLDSGSRSAFKSALATAIAAEKTIIMCAHVRYYLDNVSGSNDAIMSMGDLSITGETKAKSIRIVSGQQRAYLTINSTDGFPHATSTLPVGTPTGIALVTKTNVNNFHRLYIDETAGTQTTNTAFSADVDGFRIGQIANSTNGTGFGMEVEHFAIFTADSDTDPFATAATLNKFMAINGESKLHSIKSLFPDGEYLAYFPLIDNLKDPINGYDLTASDNAGVYFHDTGMTGNIIQPKSTTTVALSGLGDSYSGTGNVVIPTNIYKTMPTVSKMDFEGTTYDGAEIIFEDLGLRSVPDSTQDWLSLSPQHGGGTVSLKPYSSEQDGFGNQMAIETQSVIGGGQVWYRKPDETGWREAGGSRVMAMIHAFPTVDQNGDAVWIGTSSEGVNYTVTGATNANPAVLTSASHGLVTGELISLSLTGGTWNSLTSNYNVTVLTDDTFSLDGVNGTGLGSFSSGTFSRTNSILYRSTDLGTTWTKIPTPYTTSESEPTYFSWAANRTGVMLISEYDPNPTTFDNNQRYIYRLTNWGASLSVDVVFDIENPPASVDYAEDFGGANDGIELKTKHTHNLVWSQYDNKFRSYQGDGFAQSSVFQFNADGSFDQVLKQRFREQPVWAEPVKEDLDLIGGDRYDYTGLFIPSTGESYEIGIKPRASASAERGFGGITLSTGTFPVFALGRTTEVSDAIGHPRKTEMTFHVWDDSKNKMLTCVAAQFHASSTYQNASMRSHMGTHQGRAALGFISGSSFRYFDLEVPTMKSVTGFHVMPRRWNFDDDRSTTANGSITDLTVSANNTFSHDGTGIRSETCNKFTWDAPALGANVTHSINRLLPVPRTTTNSMAAHTWEYFIKSNMDLTMQHEVGINNGKGATIFSTTADRWHRLTCRGWPEDESVQVSCGTVMTYVVNATADRDDYRLNYANNGSTAAEILISNRTLTRVPTIPMVVRNSKEDSDYYAAGQAEQMLTLSYDNTSDLTSGWSYLFYMAPMVTDFDINGHPNNMQFPFLEFEDPDEALWQVAVEPWQIERVAAVTSSITVTAATNADPAVFSYTPTVGHSLVDGEEVSFSSMAGGTWSTLNTGTYTVTSAATNTFSVTDSSGDNVDGTSLGTYTGSSGTVDREETVAVTMDNNFFDADDEDRSILYTENTDNRGDISGGYIVSRSSATVAVLRVGTNIPVIDSYIWMNQGKVIVQDVLGSASAEEKDFHLDYANPIPMVVNYNATTDKVEFAHANTDTGQISTYLTVSSSSAWASNIEMIHGSISDPVNILPSAHHVVGFYNERLNDTQILNTFSAASTPSEASTSTPRPPRTDEAPVDPNTTTVTSLRIAGRRYPATITTIVYTDRGATVTQTKSDFDYLEGGKRIVNNDASEIDKEVTGVVPDLTTVQASDQTSKIDKNVTSIKKTSRGETITGSRKIRNTARGAIVDNT